MKKIIIITVSVLMVASVAFFIGVDYFGNKAMNTLIDSVSSVSIDQGILQKIEEAQTKIELSEIPIASAEPRKTDDATNKTNEIQKSTDAVKATPKPEKKEITFDDKTQAINLVKSKFSVGEIAQIQSKISKGLTSNDVVEIKALVKSRLSEQEIVKIREWYIKYK